jgi:hypothetical protein
MTDDYNDLSAMIRAVYASISGAAGEARDWARFARLHHPRALSLRTMVQADGRVDQWLFSVDEYIADVSPRFATQPFFEIEVAQRIERFGQIAHVWSQYEARSAPDSPVLLKRGANSIQAAHDGTRWWIVSTIWDDERPGVAFDWIR